MGNHTAGHAMGRAARLALSMRTNQKALDLLDEICEPWRGCDAEFEAENPKRPGFVNTEYGNYTDPNGPLGKLIAEAFGEPGRDYMVDWLSKDDPDAREVAFTAWYDDGPYDKFCSRYEFC